MKKGIKEIQISNGKLQGEMKTQRKDDLKE